jgi:cell wall-associated NlpC family hydrolase
MPKLPLLILVCFFSVVTLSVAQAQDQSSATRPRTVEKQFRNDDEPSREVKSSEPAARIKPTPKLATEMFAESAKDSFAPLSRKPASQPLGSLHPLFAPDLSERLLNALESRIGIPYRYNGVDDSGYDCSGLVWRVFQETGLGFERSSARSYWANFPEATAEESRMFGTLVFFNDLGHVGIVRDAGSFYHASTSQGVILSSLTGYWANRITGFRRIPLSLTVNRNIQAARPEGGELIDAKDATEPAEPADLPKGKKGKAQSDRNEHFKK